AKTNLTVAHLAAKGQLLTATPGYGTPRLRFWDVDGGKPTDRADADEKGAPIADPRALALVASRADGRPALVAVAVRFAQRTEESRLRLLPLGEGARKVDVPLWVGHANQPALATAPRGEYVAVAGGPDHAILVYRVADLLAPGGAKPQAL